MNVTIIEKKRSDVKGLILILLYFKKKVSNYNKNNSSLLITREHSVTSALITFNNSSMS
jgi:hypothetical protein